MAETQIERRDPITIKLKYGEYYDLKITDASKNVINQVEITPVRITTELLQLSPESDRKQGFVADNINALQRGMTEQQKDADCFFSWHYKEGEIPLEDSDVIPHIIESFEKGRELQVEVQMRRRNAFYIPIKIPVLVWVGLRRGGFRIEWRQIASKKIWSSWYYYWNDAIATTEFIEPSEQGDQGSEDNPNPDNDWRGAGPERRLIRTRCKIRVNEDQRSSMERVRTLGWAQIESVNWRFKLTGGDLNVERRPKQVFTDFESQLLKGVHSYTFPESTLIQDDSDGQAQVDKIAKHILDRYKHGRETMSLKWQGDPRITIGDEIILQDRMGIETAYMVTGNQFRLDPNGSFSMTTEGINRISL